MSPAEMVEQIVEEMWGPFGEALNEFCDTGSPEDAQRVLQAGQKINRLKWIQGQLDAEAQ